MAAIATQVRRVSSRSYAAIGNDLEADLAKVRALANLLDARFSFLGFRFGLDAIVGLVPVVGDSLTMLASVFPIFVAHRHGLGPMLKARMAGNVLLDWLVGLVPVIGDLFDATFKANLKNLKLLENAVAGRRDFTPDARRV